MFFEYSLDILLPMSKRSKSLPLISGKWLQELRNVPPQATHPTYPLPSSHGKHWGSSERFAVSCTPSSWPRCAATTLTNSLTHYLCKKLTQRSNNFAGDRADGIVVIRRQFSHPHLISYHLHDGQCNKNLELQPGRVRVATWMWLYPLPASGMHVLRLIEHLN